MDYGLKRDAARVHYLGRDTPKEMMKGIPKRAFVVLEPNDAEVAYWTECSDDYKLWLRWYWMQVKATGWGVQTAFDSMRTLRKQRDEARLDLQKARQRIGYLERRLIASAIDTPTRLYDPENDRLPFVSPESPFPSDSNSSDEDEG